MNRLIQIAVYGSLRPGEFNYEAYAKLYGNDSIEKIGTIQVTGLKLYSLGMYPAAVYSHDTEHSVVMDVLKITAEVANAITDMEIGAGYQPVFLPSGSMFFVMPEEYIHPTWKLISGGDWSKRPLTRKQRNHNRKG